MRRLSFIVVVLAVCGIVAAACGGDEKGSTASTGEGDTQSGAPQIAFLAGVVDPGYTPSQVAGLEEGSGGKVTVFNPEFDPNKQLRQCQDAITTGRYDAIVITPLDSSSAIPCAQAAMNANIPLIVDQTAVGPDLNELEPQVDGVTASVIYRPATFAEYTWDMIEQACAGQADCEAVMEISFKGDPLFDEAVEYARSKSEGTNIKIVAVYESQYDPAQTTAKLGDILVAHPDTDVVTFANDGTAIAGAETINSVGKADQIKVISLGSTGPGPEAIRDGRFFATLAVYPSTVSRIEGEMAAQAIAGEEIETLGLDAFKVGEIQGAVTKENVDDFEPEN